MIKKSMGFMVAAFALILLLLVGCSNSNINNTSSTSSVDSKSDVSASSSSQTESVSSSSSSDMTSSGTAQSQDDSSPVFFKSIKSLAVQGKILNCDYAAKSANIADVQDKWGKADTSNYVPSAKGTYDTYSKYNVAFGYNKGGQIFEVRSFDKQLSQITMSMVKADYGTPGYDYKSKTEEEIGYKVTDKFKILFVFPLPTDGNSNPKLSHYSIFYPDGTINSMAGDPGRQW
ncbi:MAG TPA: YjgB family protein [Oscillospiraceae bacterium]|nr:YjgB family protein [Oscillospiraceae bacterium]